MRGVHRSAVLAAPLAFAAALVPAAPADAGTDESGNRFADFLDLVPDDVFADGVNLDYVDLQVAWQRVGVADPADRSAFRPLPELDVVVWPEVVRAGMHSADELRSEVGFDGFEIDRVLTAGSPPDQIVVVEPSVTADAVVAALHADPVWSADLQAIDSDAGPYFQWTDDPMAIHPDRRGPLRRLGEGGTLAVLGDDPATVIRTRTPDVIEDTLRAAEGEAPSAGDDERLAEAVALLDGLTVRQAIVQPQPTLLDPTLIVDVFGTESIDDIADSAEEALEDVWFVEAYAGLVVAEVLDGESVRTDVLVIHADAANAESNAARITDHIANAVIGGEPVSTSFVDADVSVVGLVVRITIPGDQAFADMYRLQYQRALLPA